MIPATFPGDREADRLDAQQRAAQVRAEMQTPLWHCGDQGLHLAHDMLNPAGMASDGTSVVRCQGTPLPPIPPTRGSIILPAYVRPPNRILHAILSVATGGLWLIPWAGMEVRHGRRVKRAQAAADRANRKAAR